MSKSEDKSLEWMVLSHLILSDLAFTQVKLQEGSGALESLDVLYQGGFADSLTSQQFEDVAEVGWKLEDCMWTLWDPK